MRLPSLIPPRHTKPIAAILCAYFVVMLAIRWTGWYMNDYMFYVEPAREVARGTLDIYEQKFYPEVAPPLGMGYAYPPLFAIILAPIVSLGDALEMPDEEFVRYLFPVPLIFFDVLCLLALTRLLLLLMPDISRNQLLTALILAICVPGFTSASAYFNHPESLLCFFLLEGVNRFMRRRFAAAGLCLGLALLTKQTAVFVIIPLWLLLLRDAIRTSQFRNLIAVTAAIVVPFVAITTPFLVVDWANAYYGLVDGQKALIVAGESIWLVLNRLTGELPPDVGATLGLAIRLYSQSLLLAVVIILSGLLVFRRSVGNYEDLLALLVVAALTIDIFSKWTGVYYKMPAFFLLIAWDFLRNKDRQLPSLAICYVALFSLFDTLALGLHPARFELDGQLIRSLVKLPLFVGLLVVVARTMAKKVTSPPDFSEEESGIGANP